MELLGLLGRIALVFGLLALTLWVVRRTDGGRRLRRTVPTMEVLSSTRLAKGSSVALVRVGESTYVVGVTEHAVTLLTQAELPGTSSAGERALPVTAVGSPAPAPTFSEALQASTAQLLLRRHRSGAGRHGSAAARSATAPAATDQFTVLAPSAGPTSEPTDTAPAAGQADPDTSTAAREVSDGPADPPSTTPPLPALSGSTVVDLSRDAPDELLEPPCPPPRRARRAAHARGRRAGD